MNEREHDETIVPVIDEELRTGVRKVNTGGVRVTKTAREHKETIEQPLLSEEVDVRRVVRNQPIDRVPEIRQAGDTTIVPVVKEVLKIEKQLVLVEELHITKRRTEERSRQTVTLRTEEAQIERIDEHGQPIEQAQPVPVQAEPVAEQTATPTTGYRARIPHPLRKAAPARTKRR